MYPDTPFVIMPKMFFDFEKKKLFFSYTLRSKIDKIDVSKIAKKYGGGGGKTCSGFKIDKDIFKIIYWILK